MFLHHPKDIETPPGSIEEFSVKTSKTTLTYQWYFQEQPISSEDDDFRGSTTDSLTIAKCSPKHKGVYKCVVTDESEETFTSENATLTIGKLT